MFADDAAAAAAAEFAAAEEDRQSPRNGMLRQGHCW
jgi:hypothetical protein